VLQIPSVARYGCTLTTKETSEDTRRLLLIHQLPAEPAYARVKVWRRLQALGAVTVKGAVYALPANAETREDFAWLAKEIVVGGGEAIVCEAALVEIGSTRTCTPSSFKSCSRTSSRTLRLNRL
jgi:hypothetical protein